MGITEIRPAQRQGVLWLGEAAPEPVAQLLTQYAHLQITAGPFDMLAADYELSATKAVVLHQGTQRPTAIGPVLSSHVERLLDHGCMVFVLASLTGERVVRNTLRQSGVTVVAPGPRGEDTLYRAGRPTEESPALPYVRVFTTRPPLRQHWEQHLFDVLRQYDAPRCSDRPASVTCNLSGPGASGVECSDRLLLARAFSDCSEVHLLPLGEGRSGAGVYLAHATLKEGLLGPRMVPLFVKLDGRVKVLREWRNYRDVVQPYVPFHLGPSLHMDRCAVGAHRGILVGDYIEDSEVLTACTREGRAVVTVPALFDRTLSGWHRGAAEEVRTAAKNFDDRPLDGDLSLKRQEEARALGASHSPDDLRQVVRRVGSAPWLVGWIHGDLHADNVRVRGNDAVLIDFPGVRRGALLRDPAALEVSLVVRSPHDGHFDRVAWERVVRPLYDPAALAQPADACETSPTEEYLWLARCVRQVRRHAFGMERKQGQYALMLAHHLYRAATLDCDAGPDESFRRAMARVFVEKVLSVDWT